MEPIHKGNKSIIVSGKMENFYHSYGECYYKSNKLGNIQLELSLFSIYF